MVWLLATLLIQNMNSALAEVVDAHAADSKLFACMKDTKPARSLNLAAFAHKATLSEADGRPRDAAETLSEVCGVAQVETPSKSAAPPRRPRVQIEDRLPKSRKL